MLKRNLSLFLLSVFMFSFMPASKTSAAKINGNNITSQGACVMDFETGEVLYEHKGNDARVPASMTKIMNMYCIYEALANGEITLDTPVPISANVYSKSRNSTYQSVLPLNYNTTYTVDEMMDVIVVYSASGAAIAMAELIAGSEEAYVERMNNKAHQMGLQARYFDSCGIQSNLISPISMATLARNIIKDYPDILTRSSKKSVAFHGNTYRTTNHLLDSYYYQGADGLKTGTTSAAGYCFCGTAVRNGRRLISVTMSSSSTGQRFVDTARLLDYGFYLANEKYGSIYFTDLNTFINGYEVPTFAYTSPKEQAVIVAEDLSVYGFDLSYNDKERALYLTYDEDNKISPIPIEHYKGKSGQKAFSVIAGSDLKVIIDDGNIKHTMENVYDVNGYLCILAEEFAKIYESKNSGKTLSITTFPKKPIPVLPDGEILTSESAYIMDFETGDELYSFDSDTQKPVASIAKMMSVYVILDAIKNGDISLDTIVPISENVYNLSRVEDYKMMVNLEYTEKYTVDEMIDMIIIDSAAACVTAVAELISGSETEFVKLMNEKAKEIGINSVFYNGTGVCLNPETDKENLMSAKEVALMTRKMIQDYPEILTRTKCASVDFHGKTYYNLNKMFTDYYYEGADSFKNGMTTASGYCMCGTAERDGKRVITVTLPSNSNEARFTDTKKMFDYSFSVLGVDISDEQKNNEPEFSENDIIKINIDGNYEMKFEDQAPVIINNRAMIPIRALMETLEKNVVWDKESSKAIISDDTISVTLTPNSDIMVKEITNPITNEKTTENIKLDTAPVVIKGRICMPVRAVVEAFGCAVIWEEDTKTILIIAGVC